MGMLPEFGEGSFWLRRENDALQMPATFGFVVRGHRYLRRSVANPMRLIAARHKAFRLCSGRRADSLYVKEDSQRCLKIFRQSSTLQEKLSPIDLLIIKLINGIIVMSTYFFEINVII